MQTMLEYALHFCGTPYKWGGSNPMEGMDCSGFVQWVLRSAGMDPKGDQSAQALYNHFKAVGREIPIPDAGDILFFGRERTGISHVALALDKHRMIEAGGGDHTTITFADASRTSACVRVNLIGARGGLTSVIRPPYHPWMLGI